MILLKRMKSFTIQASTTISGMPHQLFAARLQARDIYPEKKNIFTGNTRT